MKSLFRKLVKKLVLFGISGELNDEIGDVKKYVDINIASIEEKISLLHRAVEDHKNSIQYFADTLAEKNYQIEVNTNNISELTNTLSERSNTIQYLSDTLSEKSFLIDSNMSDIKKQYFEMKRLKIELQENLKIDLSEKSKVYQVVPVFKNGDAIGNYALYIKSVFENDGMKADIYTFENLSNLATIKNIDNLIGTKEEDVILFHMAAENDFSELLEAYNAKKVLVYHNITPSHFFADFDEFAMKSTLNGRKQVEMLRAKVDACITVSEYNKKELQEFGYTVPIFVLPIPFEKEDYIGVEDLEVRKSLEDIKKNFLFVGRIAPNKKIEDLIDVYQAYCDKYDADARLILVGSFNESDKYYQFLKKKIREKDDIMFTGHIRPEEWVTYYRCADLFLCMSEHEGFCVPLVEAMSYNIPIIAYDSSAVGETLGAGGVLLNDKTPDVVAGVIHELCNNKEVLEEMKESQKNRLSFFESTQISSRLIEIVQKIAEDKS